MGLLYGIFMLILYLILFILWIIVVALLFSSPIIAILSFHYFYKVAPKMNDPKGDAILYTFLVMMANAGAIFLTYLGVEGYSAQYALNAKGYEYAEFINGAGQTFMNISYVMPFLVLFICLPAIIKILSKPNPKKKG